MKVVNVYFVDDQKHGSQTLSCYEVGIEASAVLVLYPLDPKSAIINFPLINILRYEIVKQ